jgi:membrane protein
MSSRTLEPRRAARGRGRSAERPAQIPAKGWWDIILRIKDDLSRDNASLVAGGLAMYGLLSVFPALAAAVSIYGLVFTPDDVARQLSTFAGVLPPGVWDIFKTDLQDVAKRQSGSLTLAAVLATATALISARSGMASLMQATNIAYQEREKRGWFRQVAVSLAFTVGGVLSFVVLLLFGIAVPLVFNAFTSPWVQDVAAILRWLLLWMFAVLGMAVVYRFAPAREKAQWQWVTWGSVVAATLWLVGSVLFSVYVRVFGSYAKTYGALGGVVVLLLWFYLSSYFLVLGAEINSEMERQTKLDTTDGPPEPLGKRGAYAADTVGPSAEERGAHRRSSPPL